MHTKTAIVKLMHKVTPTSKNGMHMHNVTPLSYNNMHIIWAYLVSSGQHSDHSAGEWHSYGPDLTSVDAQK